MLEQEQTVSVVAAMEELSINLLEQMTEEMPSLLDWTSYPGVNYECATAMIPLRSDPLVSLSSSSSSSTTTIDSNETFYDLLEQATEFPHPFYWLKRGYPVTWLYSPGDRIGLFGSLYRNVDDEVYCYVKEYTRIKWPKHCGLLTRYVGYGPMLGLFQFGYKTIWADDIFIGGYALLVDHPEMIHTMLESAVEILKDPTDGLWWHGVKIIHNDNEYSYEPNGVKWGRAHGWILLMIANYVTRIPTSESIDFLEEEIRIAKAYQRPSGAFGNIVDDDTSPDETSLTSVYVYAVGVWYSHKNQKVEQQRGTNTSSVDPEDVLESARTAIEWLNQRTLTSPYYWSDSAKGMHLRQDCDEYNQVVSDQASGPVVALALWARIGQSLIQDTTNNGTTTHHQLFQPWYDHPTPPECLEPFQYSGMFYFLSITGCIVLIGLISVCCWKCPCCWKCCCRSSKPSSEEDDDDDNSFSKSDQLEEKDPMAENSVVLSEEIVDSMELPSSSSPESSLKEPVQRSSLQDNDSVVEEASLAARRMDHSESNDLEASS